MESALSEKSYAKDVKDCESNQFYLNNYKTKRFNCECCLFQIVCHFQFCITCKCQNRQHLQLFKIKSHVNRNSRAISKIRKINKEKESKRASTYYYLKAYGNNSTK